LVPDNHHGDQWFQLTVQTFWALRTAVMLEKPSFQVVGTWVELQPVTVAVTSEDAPRTGVEKLMVVQNVQFEFGQRVSGPRRNKVFNWRM